MNFNCNKNSFHNDFYLWHQRKGDFYVSIGDFLEACRCYERALDLNPLNLLLIKNIADTVVDNNNAACLLPIIENSLHNFLKKRGDGCSVYNIASSVSFVNRKIMSAHRATQSFFSSDISLQKNVFNKLPRLVLLTCVWKRPELTEVVLSYYRGVAKELSDQIELILFAVGSEGRNSRQLCERYGFYYVEHENLPLSDKWEFGLKNTQAFNPDAVITVGSDDLLSVSLFQHYAKLLNQGYLFCGLSDGYFLDLANAGEMLYWKGYGGLNSERGMPWRLNETLGMGRMYSRLLLEKIDYSLWHGKHVNKGLDGIAKERLFSLGMLAVLKEHTIPVLLNGQKIFFGQMAVRMNDLEVFAVDVKSPGENVTNMSGYSKSQEACIIVDNSWECLNKQFPKDIIDSLKDLARH